MRAQVHIMFWAVSAQLDVAVQQVLNAGWTVSACAGCMAALEAERFLSAQEHGVLSSAEFESLPSSQFATGEAGSSISRSNGTQEVAVAS